MNAQYSIQYILVLAVLFTVFFRSFSTGTIIPAIDGTSYNYYYGADDGATRYKCSTGDDLRVEAIGGVSVGSSTYKDSKGLLVSYMLLRNSYKFDNYTLSCYDDDGVRQGTTIYINIIDARRIHISYMYPTHSDTITSSNSTVPYEIPPLAQDIRISCVMEGCGWGDSRARPVNSYYNISVMSIKENTVITSYYKYFDNAGDTTADRYKLLEISIMATGSTFAIKQSITSYSPLPAYSEITTTSIITLVCATDQTPVVSDSIQWYNTSTDAQNRIASTDSRLSLNTSTGISTLAVVFNGTYICRVNVNNGTLIRTNEYNIIINVTISSQTTSTTTTITTPTTNTITTTPTTTPMITTTTTTEISTNSILLTPPESSSTTESIISSTLLKTASAISDTQQLTTQTSSSVQSMNSSSSSSSFGSDSTTISPPLSLPKKTSLKTPKSSPLSLISQSSPTSQIQNVTNSVLQTDPDTLTIIIIPIIATFAVITLVAVVLLILVVICIVWMKRRIKKKYQRVYYETIDTINPEEPKNNTQKRNTENNQINSSFKHETEPEYEMLEVNNCPTKIEEPPVTMDTQNNRNPHKDRNFTPIHSAEYKKYLDVLFENDCTELSSEYDSLGLQEWRAPCDAAQLSPNYKKNRFKEIFPYDASRVILETTSQELGADYINASYIPGVYVEDTFIAAMGPKDCTVQDFWKMIWEQNITNIVMLTRNYETGKKKCEQYWPEQLEDKMDFGKTTVTLKSEQKYDSFVQRKLQIHSNNLTKEINHFHFLAWMDHDVPEQYEQLLNFVFTVRTKKIRGESPILVHCSAGVGRTGTFIALYNLLEQIKKGEPISVYYLVDQMRNNRPQMVQTIQQYKFIYLSVLEIMFVPTSIPCEDFIRTYALYVESDTRDYQSIFLEYFTELNYQSSKSDMTTYEALKSENVCKNPMPDSLPYDSSRVIISSSSSEGDYINASYISSECIVTMHPNSNTLRDFIKMIYDVHPPLIVTLTTPNEKIKMMSGKYDRKAYWPNGDDELTVFEFSVKCNTREKTPFGLRQELTINYIRDNIQINVTHIISEDWAETGQIMHHYAAVQLIEYILHVQSKHKNSPVIIHCSNAVGKSGVLAAVLLVIKNIKNTGMVDIFQTIKSMRNKRKEIVQKFVHFTCCYAIMNDYCKKQETDAAD